MFQSGNEIARKLVRKIITSLNQDWSIQGFGMLRMYLDKDTRLHIWNHGVAVPDVSEIHDHPWDFVSTIICGSVTNEVYVKEEDLTANMLMQEIVCGPGGHSVGTALPVNMRKFAERTFKAGESYSMKSDQFHRTVAEPGTVTIVKRYFKENTENARVCFPLDTGWVSAEPRVATPHDMLPFFAEAIKRLESEAS